MMSTATLQPQPLWGDGPPPWEAPPRATERPDPFPEPGSTLDRAISLLWASVSAGLDVACPVCGGEMVARPGHGHASVGGACRRCGSSLS